VSRQGGDLGFIAGNGGVSIVVSMTEEISGFDARRTYTRSVQFW